MKIRTIITFIIAGSLCIFESCAFRPCTTMKVQLGALNSRLVGDSESWAGTFGAQAGVAANIPYKSNLPITSWGEINLSMQGASWEEDWGEGLIKGTTRLIYLNIPLVTRYQFANGFYGEAGLQPGFLLSAKDHYEDITYDYKDYISMFDLSLPLGVGYEFPNNLGISFRVIPGLTNVNSGDYQDYMDRNFVIALKGTYTFSKKE